MLNLNKYFDKIYCINYIEGKDRYEHIKEQFKYLGCLDNVNFYHPVNLNKIDFIKRIFIDKTINLSHLSCSMSHYHVIKEAYELGYSSILVFEDDIVSYNNIGIIEDYLNNLPEDWDYINFAFGIPYRYFYDESYKFIIDNIKNSIKDCKYFYNLNIFPDSLEIASSGCYALNRKAMERYLNNYETHFPDKNCIGLYYWYSPSDRVKHFYTYLQSSDLNSYSTSNISLFVNYEVLIDKNALSLYDKISLNNYNIMLNDCYKDNYFYNYNIVNSSITNNIKDLNIFK